MPYFPKTKILYIHIPKCFGTSIEAALKKKSPMTLLAWNLPKLKEGLKHPNSINTTYSQHFTYSEIENYDIDYNYSFATVRNPFNRAISQWKYQIENSHAFKDKTVKHNFRLWVLDLYERYQNGTLRDIRHDCPQTDYIYGENDNLLVTEVIPCEGLKNINGIKLEHFNESSLKVKPPITPEIANLLSEIYERDFRLLKYSIDPTHKDNRPYK